VLWSWQEGQLIDGFRSRTGRGSYFLVVEGSFRFTPWKGNWKSRVLLFTKVQDVGGSGEQ
jgi:hypothetical protein